MKQLLCLLLLLGGTAFGQVTLESVSVQNYIPVGACTSSPLVKVSNVGTYQCVANTWAMVGPSGSGPGAGGTVTSVSDLAPLFTTNTRTTTPTFVQTPVAANTVFGNFTTASGPPTFSAAPVFSGVNITHLNAANIASGTINATRLPTTIASSTTGNATTATTANAVSSTIAFVAAANGVAPGVSAVGAADNAAALTALLGSGGNVVTIDGAYGLGSTVSIPSNTEITCTPGSGFIALPNTNAPMFENATQVTNPTACSPTTPDGVGGFTVSNLCDSDIVVDHCILNFNSTESVTNADHKTAPNGFWVTGIQLLGVNGVQLHHNTFYDSGAYTVAMDNVNSVTIDHNACSDPADSTGHADHSKNTDCFHINGPATNGEVNSNVIGPNGDDGIALNADDGYKPGTGDPNGPHVAFPGWSWGTIQGWNVHDNNYINGQDGFRLLSAQSRIDDIQLNNNYGFTFEYGIQFSKYTYPGNGNIGTVSVDHWRVQRGPDNAFSVPASILVNGNIDSLKITNSDVANSQSVFPYFLQTAGTIGQLTFRGLDFNNPTGLQVPTWLQTNGTVNQISLYDTSWVDASSGEGSLLGGTTVPAGVTISGYNGPSRLLAAGYSPVTKNGDAFTNTFPVGPVFAVNTTFNEASAGTNLAGTVPQVTTAGAAWADSSNAWKYTAGGGTSPTATGSFANIDIGLATNFGITMTSATDEVGNQIVLRYADPSNYTVVDLGVSGYTIVDVIAGASTQVKSVDCTGGNSGATTVTMVGNTISVSGGDGCSDSEELTSPSNASNTKIGFDNHSTTPTTATVTAFSAFVLTSQ